MRRLALILTLPLLLASCASGPPAFRRGERGDTIQVVEVKNLSGVSLKIPAIYFGDALGAGKDIKNEKLDLRLLGRAALFSYLKQRQYRAALEQTPAQPPKYELHAAVTVFNLDALRATGRITLGMHMMLVQTQTQEVVVEADHAEDFQLMDQAPDNAGSLGAARFIEDRLKAFAEQLAASLLQKGGL
ncbi:MAG: hypothetical protein IT462_00065 [Planctomycetes bacterium]|nr:hypothetical protein [Planctomycetota bacterium]